MHCVHAHLCFDKFAPLNLPMKLIASQEKFTHSNKQEASMRALIITLDNHEKYESIFKNICLFEFSIKMLVVFNSYPRLI